MTGDPVPAGRAPALLFTVPTPRWIRALFGSFAAVEAGALVWILLALAADLGLLVATVVPILVALALTVAVAACRISVTVADDFSVFTFRPLHRAVVDTGDIVSVELVDRVSPATLGGVGLRRMPGKVTGLLWGPGTGVEVRTVRGERIVVVVPAAAELYDALVAAQARHARTSPRDGAGPGAP